MTPPVFLLHEMETGALDGWYFGLDNARAALRSIRKMVPRGHWVLLKLVDRNGSCRIPNRRWWSILLKDEWSTADDFGGAP